MSNEAEKSDPTATPEAAPAQEAQLAAAPAPAEAAPGQGLLMEKLAPVFDHAPPEAQDFIRKNGMTILVAVVAAALFYAGASAYRNYKDSAAAEAEKLLFGQGTEQVQQVVDQYANAPVAPLALLTLASAQYDNMQYELAGTLFAQFVEKHPDHPMRLQAELNGAVCKEAAGQSEDALKAFTDFGDRNKDSFLYPESVFGRGRCLEQLGRFAEAKAAYEDFVAGHPKSPWADRAEAAILYVDKTARAGVLPQTAPVGLPFQLTAPTAAPLGLPTPAPVPAPAPAPVATPAPAP